MNLPDRYILYLRTWDAQRGKWKKIPCDALGNYINHLEPSNWMTREAALAKADWNTATPQTPYGIGFVLNGDGWFLVDIDNCSTESGGFQVDAQALYESFIGALGETSTSGEGLHIMGRCDPTRAKELKSRWDGNKEFYFQKRFVALSELGLKPIGGKFRDVDWTEHLFRHIPSRNNMQTAIHSNATTDNTRAEDDDLIERMLSSKNTPGKFGFGVVFRDLWEANGEKLGLKYPDDRRAFDHSAADLALMLHLAFWTNKDSVTMDRLFRRSGLMRDKYNIREDYRTNTINKAIRKCDNGISTPVSDNLASRDAWEPLPTALIGGELLPAPELDIEGFLPARMAAWVHEASRAKSAPPDYVFFGFLTVCASLIGNTRRAHVQPGWSQPMTFWSMCIGNPSAGKSPALDAVLDPLRSLENSIQGPHKLALAQWSDQKALAELEEKQWKKEVEKALASGAETPPIPEAMNIGTQPKMPRLIIGDATIETVMMICENHPRGILQFRDELSGWLQNMSRYTSSSDRPFWLEAGSGRAYTVDRVAREPVRIPRLLVNVLGGIQPERLQSLLLKSDDDGLLARFIVVWPDAVPLNDDTVTYSERVPRSVYSRLHLMNMEKDDTGDPSPRQIPFSESALSSFRTFRKRIRELESSSSGLMTSFLGKMPGVAATLSLLRSYIWWSEGMPRDEDTEVTDEHVDAVVTMMENYIIPMAYRTYTGFETNKSFAAVRNILHIIATKGWRQFTKRELQRSLGKTSPDSKTLDGYLHELEELDAIRQIPSDGGPGRPSLRYAVNPNSFKLLATS